MEGFVRPATGLRSSDDTANWLQNPIVMSTRSVLVARMSFAVTSQTQASPLSSTKSQRVSELNAAALANEPT